MDEGVKQKVLIGVLVLVMGGAGYFLYGSLSGGGQNSERPTGSRAVRKERADGGQVQKRVQRKVQAKTTRVKAERKKNTRPKQKRAERKKSRNKKTKKKKKVEVFPFA